jgi:hypothetical protein
VSAGGHGRPAGGERLGGGAERKRRKKRRAHEQRAARIRKAVNSADAARAGRSFPRADVNEHGVLLMIVPAPLQG